jgi:hypothetical protein
MTLAQNLNDLTGIEIYKEKEIKGSCKYLFVKHYASVITAEILNINNIIFEYFLGTRQ